MRKGFKDNEVASKLVFWKKRKHSEKFLDYYKKDGGSIHGEEVLVMKIKIGAWAIGL